MGASSRKGVEAIMIVKERVIEILNVEKMISDADPYFLNNAMTR